MEQWFWELYSSNTLKNEFRMKFGLIEQGDNPRKFLNNFTGIQTNLKLLI